MFGWIDTRVWFFTAVFIWNVVVLTAIVVGAWEGLSAVDFETGAVEGAVDLVVVDTVDKVLYVYDIVVVRI